ncbi:MAG: DUF2815 family protein [Clostridiales bacterium]|nr:DUF2815 family protein [Clostridiales bacterium]
MAAVTINDVRFSYLNVFQAKAPHNNPNGEAKFSVTILVPKSNTQAKAIIDQAIAAAIDAGASTKWNNVRPPQPAICVHDGDGVRPSDGQAFGEECKGCWVFTASAKADHPPFVVDAQVQPIIDPTKVYSGMWGNVSVSFFAYNSAGKKGIGCGLNGLQKTRDGEPLSARVTAQDAFQPVGAANPAAAAFGAPPASGYNAAMPSQAPWGAAAPQINPFTGYPM